MLFKIESRWSIHFVEAASIESALKKVRREDRKSWEADIGHPKKIPKIARDEMEPHTVTRLTAKNVLR